MKAPRKVGESSGRGRWLALALALQVAGCGSPPPAALPPKDQRDAELRALEGEHRFRAALAKTDEWLAGAPDDAVALMWKTRLLRQLGDERRALEVVQTRRAKAPRDAALAYEEGELLAHVGLDDRALAAFDEAHALAPDDALPAIAAAALLLSKKKPDTAGAQARLAPFQDGPHASAEARFHQGLALEAAGDPAGARAAFERTLELEPLHVPALRDLALLVEKSGDEKAALDLWRRVKRSASPRDEKFTQEVDAKIAALQARVEKTQAPPANAKPAPKG
jgi:tetratricopeptide (TPR) repeat protein